MFQQVSMERAGFCQRCCNKSCWWLLPFRSKMFIILPPSQVQSWVTHGSKERSHGIVPHLDPMCPLACVSTTMCCFPFLLVCCLPCSTTMSHTIILVFYQITGTYRTGRQTILLHDQVRGVFTARVLYFLRGLATNCPKHYMPSITIAYGVPPRRGVNPQGAEPSIFGVWV